MNTDRKTLDNLLDAAKREFLENGYERASLRKIVRESQVTTGAFYGYFSSKEELFKYIVEPCAEEIRNIFYSAREGFEEEQMENIAERIETASISVMNRLFEYIYDNYSCCKILLCCAGGTPYENFTDELAGVEVQDTLAFLKHMREMNSKTYMINEELCRIIVSGMYRDMFETVRRDMPKDKAKEYIMILSRFYIAGWLEMMGM